MSNVNKEQKFKKENDMNRLGREGMLDDTKPTMREDTTKSLMNNEHRNQTELYDTIKEGHYNKETKTNE